MKHSMIYLKLIATIFLWAGTATAGKILVQHMSTMMILLFRFGFSSILLYFFLTVIRKEKLIRLNKKQWLDLFFIALFGLFIHNFCLLAGTSLLPASETNIILATTPIFVSIGAALFMKERISGLNWLGIIIGIIGSFIVITNGNLTSFHFHHHELKGILYLVGVMLLWTIYVIITKDYPEKLGMEQFMMNSFALCTLMFFITAPFHHDTTQWSQLLNTPDILCIIFFIISTLFPYSWYFEGIQAIGPSKTVIFSNLMPIFGIMQAMVILGEKPTLYFFIGTLITIVGIFFVNKKKTNTPDSVAASH